MLEERRGADGDRQDRTDTEIDGEPTRDLYQAQRAWDELEVGAVLIGDSPSFRVDHMPYGGVKDSGLGREGLRFTLVGLELWARIYLRGEKPDALASELLASSPAASSTSKQLPPPSRGR